VPENLRNIVKIIILVIVAIGIIWFFTSVMWVVSLFALSLLIVYALLPIVELLKSRLKVPHGLSVGIAFLIFIGLIVVFLIVVVPITIQEVENIINDLPLYFSEVQFQLEQLEETLAEFDIDIDFIYVESIPQILQELQPALERVAHLSLDFVSGLVNILLVFLIVFFLLYDFHNIRSNIVSVCPPKYQDQARDIISIVDTNFGGYIRGTIIRLFVVGFIVGGTMYIIGMPYAFLLGLFAGVMDIFPYIGPYIAVIPALLISLSPLAPSIILVIIIYALVQALESFVLSPLVLGKAVRIKPITVLVCMLTGQQIAGILGMILFVPLAGIIRSLILYYQERQEISQEKMIV